MAHRFFDAPQTLSALDVYEPTKISRSNYDGANLPEIFNCCPPSSTVRYDLILSTDRAWYGQITGLPE